MRRLTSYICVALLALALSGLGGVLAAALCPHAGMNHAQAATAGHAGCAAKAEKAERHHPATEHQAMHSMKMTPEPVVPAQRQESEVAAVSRPEGDCGHCIGRGELPNSANTRALALKKLDAGTHLEQPARSSVSLAPVFTTQFTPTQHAPPGQSNRKHLLLSVFLI